MSINDKRLIEVAFPLKQVSLDSVHEKNVRHGHISTLHIWPARRPLAACRAALIATLLPNSGDPEQRKKILERMAGKLDAKIERKNLGGRKIEKLKEHTVGGILHWKREAGDDLDWFKDEIRKAYDGRAPKVLDPFAGGGAIPFEAMRLGCEVTAMDINPVAWFILKCTLEYPQKLAGQSRPLPEFSLEDREFMETFLKAKGLKAKDLLAFLKKPVYHDYREVELDFSSDNDSILKADLSWHVRIWARSVLKEARAELAHYYPLYSEFEPLEKGDEYELRPLHLVEINEDGIPQVDVLNSEFDEDYLRRPKNPRYIAKPTVAYLWARTVTCKQCRATVPLLKTCWLCRKDNKRVLLTMEPNIERTGVVFGVETDVPRNGGNAAQRREHDKRIGAGTMSRTGATCPCCGTIMTMQDIRLEGLVDRLSGTMTAVVVDGLKGKEYRLPTDLEREVAKISDEHIKALYADIPFGLPEEQTPKAGSGASRAFSVYGYGFDKWRKLFTNRQLLELGTFLKAMDMAGRGIKRSGYPGYWEESIRYYLACMLDRLANQGSCISRWNNRGEKVEGTFARFALPIVWDFAESNPLGTTTGGYQSALDWVSLVVSHACLAVDGAPKPNVLCQSALVPVDEEIDVIVTDPPYYDAIPYSDAMDFFHVWLRRSLAGVNQASDQVFAKSLGPKWNHDTGDGELIDDASRFDGDRKLSRKNYEDGMARAFKTCHSVLRKDGQMVVVFANKHPDAWETLVSALIRAGFVVNGSWPIQTEMSTRTRAMASAALSSSVWLVCKKRVETRPGWDHNVLKEMRENITRQLRDFWDAGIRGPDFVWAATGPAMEAFSKYPAVKKADDPKQLMTVSEFLREVRRMVVDFVVGRVLTRPDGQNEVTGLDDISTYYLLHRNDFGMGGAPVGGCILYALSCNLSDSALVKQHDIIAQSGKNSIRDEAGEEDADEEVGGTSSGAKMKLKPWNRRAGRNLGVQVAGGRPVPLIDQVHKLMHLWRDGDQARVDDYLDSRGLQRNALFSQILQTLIELADAGSDERAILESLSNHVATRSGVGALRRGDLPYGRNKQ
ncbi:MAG: DUF1156 domain-containing protein [Candidatus Dadabacteria bacterium]|nr:DUF1156 domain-containing protein [Candidatus Dadabacteria bacterium]